MKFAKEKEERITGVVVTTDGEVRVETIENSLDGFYKVCKCQCIDIASYKIGGKFYDFIVDDEGLFKENPTPTAAIMVNEEEGLAQPILFGNLFICSTVETPEGIEQASIPEEELAVILQHAKYRLEIVADEENNELVTAKMSAMMIVDCK